MFKPINNPLSDKYPSLAFLLGNIKSLSPHLDFEVYQNRVFIFSKIDKGHPDEEASLEAMETIPSLISEQGLLFESLCRNTLNGDRIDGVRIWV